jgi:hypothetical protein
MVAMEVLPLLHVPPPVTSLMVAVEVTHIVDCPVTIDGKGFTVSTFVAIHPVPSVYVIVAPPGATVDSDPEEGSIVAAVVLLLLHVPPVTASLNVVDNP